DGTVEDVRHEAGADALDLVRAGRAAGKDGAVLGLDSDDAHRVLALLQNLADAGDGAARADAGYHDIDRAVRVLPDLLGRGPAVDLGVGRVLELLRHEGARVPLHDLLGLGDRAAHALRRRRQLELGA